SGEARRRNRRAAMEEPRWRRCRRVALRLRRSRTRSRATGGVTLSGRPVDGVTPEERSDRGLPETAHGHAQDELDDLGVGRGEIEAVQPQEDRSEERRVGKGCRSGWLV